MHMELLNMIVQGLVIESQKFDLGSTSYKALPIKALSSLGYINIAFVMDPFE